MKFYLAYKFRMSSQPISIRKFPADLYKRVKLEAVRRDTTVQDLVTEAVRQYLNGKAQK